MRRIRGFCIRSETQITTRAHPTHRAESFPGAVRLLSGCALRLPPKVQPFQLLPRREARHDIAILKILGGPGGPEPSRDEKRRRKITVFSSVDFSRRP